MNHFNQSGDLDTATPAGNQGAVRDLLALTDEQILEIEPETQDEAGGEEQTAPLSAAAPGSATQRATGQPAGTGAATSNTAGAGDAAGVEPPRWLADMMSDPQSGGEARDFWHGVTQARQEAAAYREVFAQPAEARAAAQRARTLDEIDRAYFTGNASDRSQLAATMMREDPAAFREMVVEGLRALEEAEKGRGQGNGAGESRLARAFAGASGVGQGTTTANAPGTGTTSALTSALNPGSNSGLTSSAVSTGAPAQHGNAEHDARVTAYASFERSANEDLERSVGGAINRTLDQALPNTGRGDSEGLKSRLVGAIRQDVEKALQGDRQLGEQVAQLLSGKQLNNETRAQVVRLIGERAEQLVPGAAKRALKDWTQSTLAAHRERTGRGAAAGARQEVAPVATSASGRGDSQNKPGRDAAASTRGAAARSVDYRKFSDEQILEI
jgi:hypothetical protein